MYRVSERVPFFGMESTKSPGTRIIFWLTFPAVSRKWWSFALGRRQAWRADGALANIGTAAFELHVPI